MSNKKQFLYLHFYENLASSFFRKNKHIETGSKRAWAIEITQETAYQVI